MKRALAFLSFCALLACTRPGSKREEETPPTSSARTPWIEARSTEGVPLLEAPATVLPSPEGSAGVAPPFRARVVRVMVRPGERVTRGEALVEVVRRPAPTAPPRRGSRPTPGARHSSRA